MRIHDACAKTFGASGFCAQAIELIKHFLGSRVERTDQCLIQLCERFAQSFDQGLNGLLAIIKSRGERLRQRLGLEARTKFLSSLENVPWIKIIFLEQIGNVRRHECETSPRQDCWRPA